MLSKYYILLCCLSEIAAYVLKNSTDNTDTEKNMIHCYCNLSICVVNNYMCKSTGCYKKLDKQSKLFQYGCLDASAKQNTCIESLDATTTFSLLETELIECCYSDMCNSESTEFQSNNIRIDKSDEEKLNEVFFLRNVGKLTSSSYYTNLEVWFRAMLIAVPICGVMILLILVIVALKMLKSDKPEDKLLTSTKLLKQTYEITTVNNRKNVSKFNSFVFKPCQDKQKYVNLSKDIKSSNVNLHSTNTSDKFSQNNFKVLNSPYKFSELKS